MINTLENLQQYTGDKKDASLLSERVNRLANSSFSLDVIRMALDDPNTRFPAFQTITNKKLVELLPDVEKCFREKPDPVSISVLTKLGEKRHLEFLLKTLPEIVDLSSRKEKLISHENIFGEEYRQSNLYASIVKGLGRLATKEAVLALKEAARDYDPRVRSAACEAFYLLPPDTIDDELREIVAERLKDSPPYVADAAKKVATCSTNVQNDQE